jgi:hypothetical protein
MPDTGSPTRSLGNLYECGDAVGPLALAALVLRQVHPFHVAAVDAGLGWRTVVVVLLRRRNGGLLAVVDAYRLDPNHVGVLSVSAAKLAFHRRFTRGGQGQTSPTVGRR